MARIPIKIMQTDGSYSYFNENSELINVPVSAIRGDEYANAIFLNGIKELEDAGLYNKISNTDFDINRLDQLILTGESQKIKDVIEADTIPSLNVAPVSMLHHMSNKNLISEKSNELKAIEIKTHSENTKLMLASNLNIANSLDKLFMVLNVGGIANDNNMILQSETIGSIVDTTTAIDKLAKETKDKSSTVNMGNVTMDNTSLVEATNNQTVHLEKIANASELKQEHYEYLKNGSETLKDSEGSVIIPRDINSKYHAEKHIEQKDMNETAIDDVLNLLGDIVYFGGGVVDDVVSDLGGLDSGMNLGFNPFNFISDILTEDWEAEIEIIEKEVKKNG